MKSLKRIITLLSILLFVLSGCSFNQKFNISKTGKITIVIGSACRSADIDQLIKQKNAFLKIKIHGALEDSKIVKFERGASISFNNIPIDSEVYLEGYIFTEEISEDGESIKNVILYKGKSETVVIEPGDNKISLKLKSVGNDNSEIEISTGSDDNGQSETNTDTGNQNGNTGGSSGNTGGNTGGSETCGTEHPATGKIEIYMNAEDQIFAEGSEIVFTAQDAEGKAIAAENISVEFNVRYFYNNQWDVYTFISKIDDPVDGEYEIVKNGNEVIITTQITVLPPDQCFYYFTATITDGSNQENKTFDEFELIPGQRTETKFFASYNKDEVYINGSTIVFTAKDKDNNPIPADKLKIEFFEDYNRYNPNPSEISYYTIERAQYNAFVTTTVLGGDMARYEADGDYYLFFVVTNTLNGESRQFIIDFIYEFKQDTTFVMEPGDGIILPDETITVHALDKNLLEILGENISLTSDGVYYIDKMNQVPISSEYYSTDNHNGFSISLVDPRTDPANEPMPDDYFKIGQKYSFTLKVSKGSPELQPDTKTFSFTLKYPEVSTTIDVTSISPTELATTIQTAMTDILTYNGGTLELIFTGKNNTDGFNLYSSVMDVVCAENVGFSKTSMTENLILDYSGCSGTALSEIPANTFKNVAILKSLILSDSTTTIGESAFESCMMYNLNLNNVTTIEKYAFQSSYFTGTLNMPNVTVFGNQAGYNMQAKELILGSATEIYKTDDDHGQYVFAYSNITNIIAPKLQRIQNFTFYTTVTNNFAIDSLRLVGNKCLQRNTNTNYPHYIHFENEENKQNWYKGTGGFNVDNSEDGSEEAVEDIFVGLLNGTYTINEVINHSGNTYGDNYHYIEAVDPDDIISELRLEGNSYSYIRVVPNP